MCCYCSVQPSFGLIDRRGSSEDGVIKCTARREIRAFGADSNFVNLDEQYTLFLATGDVSSEGTTTSQCDVMLGEDYRKQCFLVLVHLNNFVVRL